MAVRDAGFKGQWARVHSGPVELVFQYALPDLFPAERAFSALVEVLNPAIQLGAQCWRQGYVWRWGFVKADILDAAASGCREQSSIMPLSATQAETSG